MSTSLEEILRRAEQDREKTMAEIVGLEGISMGKNKIVFTALEFVEDVSTVYRRVFIGNLDDHCVDEITTTPNRYDWSADGTAVAFIEGNELVITDLLRREHARGLRGYHINGLKCLTDHRILVSTYEATKKEQKEQLLELNLENGESRTLASFPTSKYTTHWMSSDDGTTIYASSTVWREGEERKIMKEINDISPDGKYLLHEGYNHAFLEVIPTDWSPPRRLYPIRGYKILYGGAWVLHFSPDGERVGAVCNNDLGEFKLLVWHTQSSEIEYEINVPHTDEFIWSPDSDKIALRTSMPNGFRIADLKQVSNYEPFDIGGQVIMEPKWQPK